MSIVLQREIERLKEKLLALGALVEADVRDAVRSVEMRNPSLARKVLEGENRINAAEVEIETECLEVMALHQPVATDLRCLVTVLKINQELERIGDLATHIAERSLVLCEMPLPPLLFPLIEMAEKARSMLTTALDAFVTLDRKTLDEIRVSEDTVNNMNRQTMNRITAVIMQRPEQVTALLQVMHIARHIERIADHATNIAEDIVYLLEGKIVRHRVAATGLDQEKDEKEIAGRGASFSGRKTTVLFVCVHNSARSVMAEAWLNHLYGDEFAAESAGLSPGVLNPFAVAVMREAGIDISCKRPRSVTDPTVTGRQFEYVITVCDDSAAEGCPVFPGGGRRLHWSFPDPSALVGSDDYKLAKTREIRDAIRRRIEEWVSEIRSSTGASPSR